MPVEEDRNNGELNIFTQADWDALKKKYADVEEEVGKQFSDLSGERAT